MMKINKLFYLSILTSCQDTVPTGILLIFPALSIFVHHYNLNYCMLNFYSFHNNQIFDIYI